MFSPWMGSIILTPANTNLQLSALLAVKEPNLPTRCSLIIVEFDLSGVGNVWIGNNPTGGAALSPTNCGRHLVPTAFTTYQVFDSGLYLTTDIWLRADNNNQQMNCIILPAGM